MESNAITQLMNHINQVPKSKTLYKKPIWLLLSFSKWDQLLSDPK